VSEGESHGHLHLVDEALELRADPRGGAPSPIEGVTLAELESMLEKIRWFSHLSVSEKLALSQLHQRRARRFIDMSRADGA
jgi:hypothetical protein